MDFFDEIDEIDVLQEEIDTEGEKNFTNFLNEILMIIKKYNIAIFSVLLGILIIILK